jgi:hypothetical protein
MQSDNPFAAPTSLVADPSGASGPVPPGVVETLRRTKGWVRFLAVLGFVFSGLMLLFALVMGLMGLAGGGILAGTPAPVAFSIGYAVFLVLMSLLYIVPCVHLLRYAAGIQRLESLREAAPLEEALEHQRAFWKFLGVAAIVLLGLYALLLASGIAVGMFAAMRGGA